ncbi:hypothetical protein [Streptomyces sp. NPDC001880]
MGDVIGQGGNPVGGCLGGAGADAGADEVDAVKDAGATETGGWSLVGDRGEEVGCLTQQQGPLAGQADGEVDKSLSGLGGDLLGCLGAGIVWAPLMRPI